MAPEQHEPIAVVGMACRFPGGSDSPAKLWDLLRSPRNLVKRVPTDRFNPTAYFHPNGSHHGTTDCQEAYFLDEDVSRFDNSFFNIQPAEAEAMDPQQRLLMETIYDSLSAGGQTIEGLRGSRTAVYVGLMCDDWAQMTSRDWDIMQTYSATGVSRAIVSNRVSYFFDWHGPSVTIDTACSSSLVAVHQGVAALRNGECPVAVVAGANLILAPGMWIAESNLHMLSPTGTSKMWDAAADGYARGEGVAAVVLKPLSAALRDGDHIECIVRETGVNQDGRTAGITMPNGNAQAELIRETYRRAGLDINDPTLHPQYFHAHGTGTPAGDPQEAEAISCAFFEGDKVENQDPLYVGSIKTVIGHTEGAAGLASLIGTALAMKHNTIPANLHFNTLSPRVAPFYARLEVPTKALPWPNPSPGQPRRASVNSFGFGGTNAHAIIEGFDSAPVKHEQVAVAPLFTPLTISAASLPAFRAMLSDLASYLKVNPETNIRDLAHTLQAHRSTLGFRKSISCKTVGEAISTIDGLLADDASGETSLASRFYDILKPSVLGVFTGQGAQWPRMGAQLIEQSPYVGQRIDELDCALSSLPASDRPTWTLRDQLLADATSSRLSEAAISQPLCTAVQIVLVDLLRAANIQLKAVVGHSSGEIAAAYAAGFLTASDAIRIAYYRGLFAKLARSPSDSSVKGAMMAVGTSFEDASEFCELDDFAGRIRVAARNSPTSMTLSGDEDAIEEAVAIFQDEGRFARQLRVDTAYHSHHMDECAAPYREALAKCNIVVGPGNDTMWISSVVENHVMSRDPVLQSQYWVDNMTNAVLFAPAVADAHAKAGPFDMALEVGPHPALKGPCLDTLEIAVSHQRIPYTSLISRGKDDVHELASALGDIWTQLGAGVIDFGAFEDIISSNPPHSKRVIPDLPTYPFDHPRSFYTLTRFSGGTRNVHAPPHPLLGRRCVESETADEVSWRNVLRPTEVSWLHGHQLQGQTVFPAMGYVAMAVEAGVALALGNSTSDQRPLGLISLEDVVIGRALAFGDESIGVESKVTMRILNTTDDEFSAEMTCHSGLPFDDSTPLALNFSTKVSIAFHDPEPDILPITKSDEINLASADAERLYTQFGNLGYNYSSPFTGVRAIHRKLGYATGDLEDESGDDVEDQLIVHPGWLDSAIQTGFAAYCHPHDMRLWALHVPTAIRSVVINPYFTARGPGRTRQLKYQSVSRESSEKAPILLDIGVFAGQQAFVQFEGLQVKPFAAPGPRDDAVLFARFDYKLAGPDAVAAVGGDEIMPAHNEAVIETMERVGFFYLRRVFETITPEEAAVALPHFKHLLKFAGHMVSLVQAGEFPTMPREAMADTPAFIRSLVAKYRQRVDMRVLAASGENLVAEIRRNGNMLEHLMEDGMLYRFYEEGAGFDVANVWLARVVAQITHRYPRMRIFEIGAGTGGSTRIILPILGDAFGSYTFTDVSAGFFERAQERFREYADRLVFATYNMEQPPAEQGLEQGSYDVVIASNVLHATGKIDETMANARQLLRPGGYLVVYETISNDFMSNNAIFGGLPGWWAGAAADSTRCNGPCLTLTQWDALARKHGFGGIDTHTPVEHKLQSYSVFACQAVDERVVSLRHPLATSDPTPASSPVSGDHLVVVGGTTPIVRKLAEEVCSLLRTHYATITQLLSLEELNSGRHNLVQGSSVLSLTEFDQQFFEARSASKLEALKLLWRQSRTVLWATRGARDQNPYSAMILGLSRCVRYEQPHLNLQVLDFDDTPPPQTLAEELIRLELAERWAKEGQNLLWNVEPEVHHVKGQVLVPRLCSHVEANNRYNTYRREVTEVIDPKTATVALQPALNGETLDVCTVSPLRLHPTVPKSGNGRKIRELQVRNSLLQVIKVSNAGFFGLCAGEDTETGEALVTLVDTTIESRVQAPKEWTLLTQSTTAATLGAVATHLLAEGILAAAPSFGTVLVHGADDLLKNALEREAAKQGVRVVCTTIGTKSNAKSGSPYIFIHPKLPMRLVQKLLPPDVSLFVDLSTAPSSAELLVSCLPPHTTTAVAEDFVRTQPEVFPNSESDQVGSALQAAWQAVTKKPLSSLYGDVPVIPVQDINHHSAISASPRVVDWAIPSIRASLRPIDAGTIFRADGTYLLVGLSGEIGQSLGTWMVAHGARYIVLSSRRPNVHPQYIESIKAAGATIKVMALDVGRRESVYECHDAIRAEMPPVIGVANGAMVLEDSLFDDLEFASIERSFPPKVDGSMLLDELFYDAPLDFFIMLTSAANITGNTGQSSYIMANQCMTALALQRRDVRGVPGSVMAIGILQGLGYFEHTDLLEKDHFGRMGYRDISEQDLHQLFAEAILAGRPGSTGNSEVITGVAPFHDGGNIQEQLRTDPKFGHFVLHRLDDEAALHNLTTGGKLARLRARLATVKTHAEALAEVQLAFVDRLKRILMMPPTEVVDPLVSLIELGTDSIMAVDVRSWFLKELDVDIPVLKILGVGETVSSLVEEAVRKVPATILDLAESGTDAPVTSTVQVPAETKAAVGSGQDPAAKSMSSSSISSSDTTSSGSPLLQPTPLTPPDLSTGFGTGESSTKEQLSQLSESHPEEQKTADDWRRSILDSAEEYTAPMTFGQKRFWFLRHYIDDPTTFNIASMAKLSGSLRVPELARAVEAVAQRHEALRTRFFWSDDRERIPMQGILSKPLVRLETAIVESEAQAIQELEAMRYHEWDLGDWVPLRVRLLSLARTDAEHYLILGAHHISMDGHSINMLMFDINQAYSRPGSSLPPLADASQARAFGEQQISAYRTGKLQPAIEYYRHLFLPVDLGQPIELFSFARSQTRLPLERYENHSTSIRLEPQVAARMKQLARNHRATSFHGYLAALQALVFRLLPAETTEKVVIGIADANRLDSKFMGSIGNFINVLPLLFNRTTGSGQTFGQAVEESRKKVYSALQHSALPFDLLLDELAVPRSNAHPPVCQIFMDYKLVTREQRDMRWAGCNMSDHKWLLAKSPYDIALEIVEDHDSSLVVVHAQEALYSKAAAELFLRSYVNILSEVVKPGGDECLIGKLDRWDPIDVKESLALGKGPDLPLVWPSTVAHSIDEVIAQWPDNIAVKDGFGHVLTYAELDERVESIALALRASLPNQGLEQSVVGVFQTPAADWIASMIAILRVGAVYLPLDLKVSAPRLKSYVKVAKPTAILADNMTIGLIEEIGVEDPVAVVNVHNLPNRVGTKEARIGTAAQPNHPAYMIFTSGSTGTPKGVVVKHSSLRALAEGFVTEWDIATLGRVVLQQFPLNFDGSLKQIISAITTGGCLFVAPADSRGDPNEITRLMAEHDVTFTVATPSEWCMWFRFAPDNLRRCTALRSAWFGGERAPNSLLDSFRSLSKILPNLRVFNTYGPTEATVSTVKGEVDMRVTSLSVPIPSRILPNYAVYIVDDESRPVPVGVPGEIVIGGAGVGENEYLDRPDLTAKHFLADPFAPVDKHASGWGRMYYTGDYGRLNSSGLLAIEGRVAGDAQVKVRGFRVELGEIEDTIVREAAGSIVRAVVGLRAGLEGDHDEFLTAHVVLDNYNEKSEAQVAELIDRLRNRLSLSLPQYMVPAVIVPINYVPLTAHGKADRKAVGALPLPQIKASIANQQEQQMALTSTERFLGELWTTILPAQSLMTVPLAPQSDFFHVGGNSLLLVKLQAAIKRAFGDAPRLSKLMSTPKLGDMANLLETEGSAPDWSKEIALDLQCQANAAAEETIHTNKDYTGLRILVTGATGSLGRHTVPHLAANSHVTQVVVLARPVEGRDLHNLFPDLGDKVRVLSVDLPHMPSDNTAELVDIDVILHMAADRNFWDGYGPLKSVNVDTTKALAKLALRTGAVLHVLSSGALEDYESGQPDEHLPQPDPADGYIASKWVAERYLANAVRDLGLRATAHRPTKSPAVAEGGPCTKDEITTAEHTLISHCLSISPRLGVRPSFHHVGGTLHIAPIEDVATAVASEVTNGSPQSDKRTLGIVNYPGTASVRTEVIAEWAEKVFSQPENAAVQKLPAIPALHWVGLAKRSGLFEWFLTSQELLITDEEGRSVVSRR